MPGTRRIVIVGGGPAGAAAASRARRVDESAGILLVDRGNGHFDLDPEIARSWHRIDLRLTTEAREIDPRARTVRLRSAEGSESLERYTQLVLCTGVTPILPPGLRGDEVSTKGVQVDRDRRRGRTLVLGAGLSAVEAAASALDAGEFEVILLVPDGGLLPELDEELVARVRRELTARRVRIEDGASLDSLTGGDGRAFHVRTSSGSVFEADRILPRLGVCPDVALAQAAGVKLGATGAIAVGRRMETNLAETFAAGGCAEAPHAVLSYEAAFEPSRGSAVRAGRVAGASAAGATNETFDGILGARVARAGALVVAKLGLSERDALAKHYDVAAAHAHPALRSAAHPSRAATPRPEDAGPEVKIVLDRMSGWILGVQVVGPPGSERILDLFAAAIVGGMPVDKIAQLDLPAFDLEGDARPPVSIAAMVAENVQRGQVGAVSAPDLRREQRESTGEALRLLDVREHHEAEGGLIAGATCIPYSELRSRLSELDPAQSIVVYSPQGRRAYLAARILMHNGFTAVRILSGGLASWPYDLER